MFGNGLGYFKHSNWLFLFLFCLNPIDNWEELRMIILGKNFEEQILRNLIALMGIS